MTPKEKAEELVSRYRKEILRGKYRIDGFVVEELAEECALIAVGEILNSLSPVYDYDRHVLEPYWLQVKQIIEAL